jgi:polysaccharide deacetylase 2 family uncharacterized protein YibQ
MPRTKRRSPALPRTLVVLAASASLLFLGGEAWQLASSGRGRVALARGGLGDRARVVTLFAREIRDGLAAAGVAADSVRETDAHGGPAAVRWRVGLRPDASLFQTNYAVSRRIEELGGVVLAGREAAGPRGETRVTLLLGLPKRALHELVLVRGVRPEEPSERPAPRLALVLFGFGDDPGEARRFFELPVPFAVALAPDAKGSSAMFRAARETGREVVLHIPLEPINYPQLNPGPGTLLVTMKPDRATGTVRRWLDQAGPVVGVANHMGSLATQDMTLMGAVYRELRRRHLPFVHLMPAAGAVCRPLAAEMGVIYDEPDAVLDAEARAKNAKALDQGWAAILERARKRERTAVWVRATPLSREWLKRATTVKRLGGVDLAPLSGVIRRPVML